MTTNQVDDETYLSGRAAAALLGVKLETLYAYASRGIVRSEPGLGGRARRYRREDLERLKARHDARAGHGAVAASALRWGEPVLESAITRIEEGTLQYRGHAATDLAEQGVAFEAVAELLWTGTLDTEPRRWAHELEIAPSHVARLAKGGSLLATLAIAVPSLAAADPARFDGEGVAEILRARSIVLRMAALVGAGIAPERATAAMTAGSVARAILVSLGVPPTRARAAALDAALILSADHELNCSAFAARVTASTGSDLYSCVSAGLAALVGPRHGGSCDRVEALAHEIGKPERAAQVVHGRAQRGELVPGFGHKLYPDGDPRAMPLLRRAIALAPKNQGVRVLLAVDDAMRAAARPPPTIDVGLVALASALGLPEGGAAALFGLGRAAGWIAHAFEQRQAGFMLRPRARYVGP